MPRAARHVLPGVPLHIVQRGISGNDCFFGTRDYQKYLQLLVACSSEFPCAVHAYCLMTNHVHLLLTPGDGQACSGFMKRLSQCYVQTINERQQRSGTLWEGRYYSCLLLSERYVLACYRYIELNPVRAGMVGAPEEYEWSSFKANAAETACAWLVPHPAYSALGDDRSARTNAYRSLCLAGTPTESDHIRRATRLGCVAGTVRRSPGRPRSPR